MKKVLSIFLALIMILSIGTVGVSAANYVWIYTSRKCAKIDNYLYFPVYYDNGSYYACYGDEDAKVKITIPFFYDPEVLKPVEVTPSELLYGMNFTSEISEVGVYTDVSDQGVEITYPYFYADITFDGDTKINKGEVLFNVKMEIIGDLGNYNDFFDHFYLVEDLEQEKLTCCKWQVIDGNGNIAYDISSQIWQNVPMDGNNPDTSYVLEGYEPFIPPVEKGKLTADTKFESGETYYINNYEDFKTFIDLINAGQTGQGSKFELTSDIIINHGKFSLDVNNEPLYVGYPITKNTKLIECKSASDFRGTLDGKNHSIMGYYSKTSGIFDLLYRAEVKNLCIKNSLFDLRGSSAESAGAVAAKTENATVSNIVFKGIIINDGANTGGIVGKNIDSSVIRCKNRGTVIGNGCCGGIIGIEDPASDNSIIQENVNYGTVESTGDYVGGIVSFFYSPESIIMCANVGTVKSTGNYVGGIVGDIALVENTMERCYHTGTVSGNDYVGGLAGRFYTSGNNLESEILQLEEKQSTINMYEEMYLGKDGWGATVYPPIWATENNLVYLFEDRDYYLNYIWSANSSNFIYSYSAGEVTSDGEYVGAIFGEFDGCVWRSYENYFTYEQDLYSSGKNAFDITMNNISSYAREAYVYLPECGIYARTDDKLKSEAFAKEMSTTDYPFVVDTNNENNGYVILKALVSDENEPGYTDITQTVTDLTIGTTDKITFASDETKTYSFTPETDGDYKVTVLGKDKTLVEINAYKNGELLKEGFVATTDEYPAYEASLKPISKLEIDFEGLVAGEEIVLKITDSINKTIAEEPTLKLYAQYFMPSSISITVENVTPVVEDQPLFEFGVTSQHIRNQFDMVYYPASFGFSMYDDADIRYSDICADVADLAFGCDTEVVMKYIYDATTLDFVSVYEDFWEGSVEVLEHGSTGETGPDGQEYNYIVIKAKFIAVGYANDTAPYYLKFAVVEENFVNSDGTVRKVIDNVPYSEGQLCVWNAWDAKGNSFDFSDKIKFKSSDYETDGYTYDNLLLEDDLIDTDIAMPTVTFTPEHARKGDLAYYPCMYDSNVDYEEWVRSATGFKDSTTKIQIKVNYDSSTLELLDALPSKELYDLGGTVTIIETGYLYPDDPNYGNLKYAVVQLEFDALDFNEGCLFSLKFRVLQENFLDEDGYPIDLVNSFVADWVVTSNAGKSHDLRYYVSSSYAGFESFGSYEELILADYEPFDPILLTDVTEVTYVQQEDTHKTFTVTVNGRKQMIQFIEPDGGTRTYDRYNKNVKITSYNADGEVVSSMARDLAYEVWEIYSNMSVGVEIQVRGKENYKWDEFRYSFTIEPYNPIISMELSSTSGKKGPVPATVVADEKTEKVMFKMPNGTSVTVSNFTTDENGNRVFTGNAWMNEDGLNEIEVKIYRKNVWKTVGTLEYTVE